LKEFSLFKFDEKNDAIVLDGGSGAKKTIQSLNGLIWKKKSILSNTK
jgi:hypothetical protein